MNASSSITANDIYAMQAGEKRRTAARQQTIFLQLKLAAVLEPIDEGKDKQDWYWSERKWIEGDIERMAKIIQEPVV